MYVNSLSFRKTNYYYDYIKFIGKTIYVHHSVKAPHP